MNSVNRTLYIPLYGKAMVSRQGILLHDPKAEEIWQKEGVCLKGKAASKWLAYNMAMRAAVFDQWTEKLLKAHPGSKLLHIGCGLDSRCLRVSAGAGMWYDIDFPEVIQERQKYYEETESYRMVGADVRRESWKREIPSGGRAVVVMEGVSMYLRRQELVQLITALREWFSEVHLLMDCYSVFAAKASKYKNPVNEMGVTTLYGLDDPQELAKETGFAFLGAHDLTPETMIRQLTKGEQTMFHLLYAGKTAKSLYRLYEFEAKNEPA